MSPAASPRPGTSVQEQREQGHKPEAVLRPGTKARGRWHGIFAVGTTTMTARGISLIANFAIIPIVAHHLNGAEFGLWLSLTTAFTLLTVLDFGLGPAVMEQVSEARSRGDLIGMRRVVSTAFVLLSGASLTVVLVSGLLVLTVDWSDLLGVGREIPDPVVRDLLFAVATTVALSLPLVIARRVFYALQRGHAVALCTVLGVVLQSLGLLCVSALTTALGWFLAVYLLTSLVADATTTLLLLGRFARDLRPRLCDVDRRTAGLLVKEGGQHFFLMAIGVVAFQIDAFIIGHYLGVSRVPEYTLAFRVFSLVPAFAAMFLTPLWVAYREAWVCGNHEWIQKAYVRSLLITVTAAALAGGACFAVTPPLLRAWLDDEAVSPSSGLLAALACYVVVTCTSSSVGVFLKGLGVLRLQVGLGAIMAFLNIAVSIWSVKQIGLSGPVWATVATQTFVVLIPCMWYTRRHLAERHAHTPEKTPQAH